MPAVLASRPSCADYLRRRLDDPRWLPRLVVQPIIDLAQGAVAGYEALARLGDPGDDAKVGATVIGPAMWFAAAREAGLATQLEARVVSAARALYRNVPPGCFLTLNVSPEALPSREVSAAFAGGELTGIVVEVTEQTPGEDLDALAEAAQRLRAAGATVAVDDAGAGYADLQRLLALRPQMVKLDRYLVNGVDTDLAKQAAIELLGDLADRLDAWVVAEGVERREELRTLVRLGVPLAQGWLLGRAGPPWPRMHRHLEADVRAMSVARATGGGVGQFVEAAGDAGPRGHVVVDAGGRPVALELPVPPKTEAGTGDAVRRAAVSLRVAPETPVADVIRRALLRPPALRYDPIVCTSATGETLGLVHLDDLVLNWLSTAPTADHRSRAARLLGRITADERFRCGDVVPGCTATLTGLSEDEVLASVAAHAREAHGMAEVPESVAAAVRARLQAS